MQYRINPQVIVTLSPAQANALLPIIDEHCSESAYAVCEALDTSIESVVIDCFEQTSRADRRILESDDGARYALEWIEWAQRTGFDCLQGYTKPQLQHIADRLHEQF